MHHPTDRIARTTAFGLLAGTRIFEEKKKSTDMIIFITDMCCDEAWVYSTVPIRGVVSLGSILVREFWGILFSINDFPSASMTVDKNALEFFLITLPVIFCEA